MDKPKSTALKPEVRLAIRNVRSFAGSHAIRIAPLTILVGENSSGKSTFMAMLSSILSHGYPLRPSFGVAPFDLGGFSNIITNIRTRSKKPTEFVLGLTEGSKGTDEYAEMSACFSGVRDSPVLSRLSLSNQHGSVELLRTETNFEGTLQLNFQGAVELAVKADLNAPDLGSALIQGVTRLLKGTEAQPDGLFEKIFALIEEPGFLNRPSRATAPIRTKPRRIYDGTVARFSPEGQHIPNLLARLTEDSNNPLKKTLATFGRDTGLFNAVDVRTFGHSASPPFQLRARMPGVTANLTDVGYGVSQVLPILVETLFAPPTAVLMLQQPEVHLHPRAQAELGTLFAQIVTERKGATTFVVETHSDYLLNRVRKEIAMKTIAADMVSLLFFEKREAATKVHELQLDSLGNISNAPRSYRSFFVTEELSLLTRAD